jgi:hypothetical protein
MYGFPTQTVQKQSLEVCKIVILELHQSGFSPFICTVHSVGLNPQEYGIELVPA